jgi:hypothetical protein
MTKSRLRQQTTLWRTAVSTDLRTAIQQEIEALRASVDQRVAALESVVSRNDKIFDQLTADVHAAAAEEVEAAATQARGKAEAAAQSELSTVRARLQADLETAQSEWKATRAALEKQLAETQRGIIAISGKRDELAASLDKATKRIETLEKANAQMVSMRQVADARLEEEVQRRTMLTLQLDAGRQEIVLAKAEADSRRLEARVSTERVSALEKQLAQLEAEVKRRPVPVAVPQEGSSDVVFDRIRNGLDELRSVKTEELLSTLMEHLSTSFGTVAVFAVKGKSLRLWKRGAGDSAAIPTQVSFESESPLARAAKHRATVTEEVTLGDGKAERQTPRAHMIALPLLAHDRVMAVAYAQNPAGDRVDRLRMAETIAEIFVGCVNQRLSRTQSSIDLEAEPKRTAQQANTSSEKIESVSDQYAVSRQARRVKVPATVEVLIDGVASRLLDLSALGAQIMSPTALRPNRCVRVALAGAGGRLTCEGRIVWAQLESAHAQTSAMYRAGVRFVDVNSSAITTLVAQYGPTESPAVKSA